MTKKEGLETQQQVTPTGSGLPEGAPGRSYPTHDWQLQAIMEMHNTLGKVEQAVTSLGEDVKEHSADLKQIGRKVFAAEVLLSAIVIFITVFGIAFLNKLWNLISALSQIKPPH